MNRGTKLAAWAGVWAALAAGPGCGAFDNCCCCDDGPHRAEYTRETGDPNPPGRPAPAVNPGPTDATPTPTAPGVHPDGR